MQNNKNLEMTHRKKSHLFAVFGSTYQYLARFLSVVKQPSPGRSCEYITQTCLQDKGGSGERK